MTRASNRWTEAAQVAALFALLAATQAGAQDFSKCDVDMTHGGQSEWRDLGGGFVVSRSVGWYFAFGTYTAEGQLIEDCKSGKIIDVDTYKCQTSQYGEVESEECIANDGYYDFRDEVDAILDQAASPNTSVSVSELLKNLKATVGPNRVHIRSSQDVSCACQTAYPGLRGGELGN